MPAVVTAIVIVVLAIGAFGAALYFLVAQRLPELTSASLTAAQQRWAAKGPPSYSMSLKLGGARPGAVHIEVQQGEAVSMQRDGRTPTQERTWRYWTVVGMFETLERELEIAEDPVNEMHASQGAQLWLRCEFDPQYGYPARFHRAVRGGGPEVYWQVTRFQALP